MKDDFSKIVVILPAFNEEENIPVMLEGLCNEKKESLLDLTVLIVNDGSQDKTREAAMSYSQKLPLQVLNHESNQGVGRAFLTGLRKAAEITSENDVIILMEADNTSEIKIMRDMAKKLDQGFDVVCASRHIKGGGYLSFPFKRLVLSHSVNILLRVVFRLPQVTDYTIFYRAYKAGVIKNAFLRYGDGFISYRGFVANVELLLKLSVLKVKFSEVPFNYDYGFKKSKSKMKIRQTIRDYLHFIWRWKCRAKE